MSLSGMPSDFARSSTFARRVASWACAASAVAACSTAPRVRYAMSGLYESFASPTTTVPDALAEFAPVHVAMGNNDRPSVRRWGARDAQVVDAEGLRIGLIHDAGPALARGRRMRRRFPAIDLVVFGHSHIPIDVVDGDLRLFNPG